MRLKFIKIQPSFKIICIFIKHPANPTLKISINVLMASPFDVTVVVLDRRGDDFVL